MKRYFNFKLNGTELLLIWLVILIFFIGPVAFSAYKIDQNPKDIQTIASFIALIFVVALIPCLLMFQVTKLVINNTEFDKNNLHFDGEFGKFLGVFFGGLGLTIITLGIYFPWFYRNMNRYFMGNTRLKDMVFQFLGKGGPLLVILLLAYIIPMAIIQGIYDNDYTSMHTAVNSLKFSESLLTTFITIPYTYLVYKWLVDIKYKNYHIHWKTEFWPSVGTIALQYLFMVITFGIYAPAAYVKIYAYFAERTYASSDNKNLHFGYDLDAGKDFLFIWGQILLTIITAFIYLPWAYCKIGKYMLSKTFLTEA